MKQKSIFSYVVIFLFLFLFLGAKGEEKEEFKQKRNHMVGSQLKSRDIHDSEVLRSMSDVQRHKFVPKYLQDKAYEDRPLPIGQGQTISQPYIVALMTQLADLKENERVLEIGTGSGYQAAVLSNICQKVYSIEIKKSLAQNARNRLKKLGYDNVQVRCGNGFDGWEAFSPYDAIIVTCAPSEIPPALISQLAEGGVMVIPVGEDRQMLKVIKKEEDELKVKEVIPVRFVPMIGKEVLDTNKD